MVAQESMIVWINTVAYSSLDHLDLVDLLSSFYESRSPIPECLSLEPFDILIFRRICGLLATVKKLSTNGNIKELGEIVVHLKGQDFLCRTTRNILEFLFVCPLHISTWVAQGGKA